MKKIVFILATDSNTNNIKRIEEFVENGYDVEVYSFRREVSKNKTDAVKIQVIGEFSNDLPYLKRVKTMWKGIKYVLNKTKDMDCIYYLIRNDVAILYSMMSKKPYIFEEADLTQAVMRNKIMARFVESKTKKIIKNSLLSVFTSEGFIKYHFGSERPENVYVIPNRLHPSILSYPVLPKGDVDSNHIKFGFVGNIRYDSIFNFSSILLRDFPMHELHFFGKSLAQSEKERFAELEKYTNCFFHGEFKSPDDLPKIYDQIDVLLCTYDIKTASPRFAEPNKLYESIYFKTPIIVSSNTFIAEKVNRLGIGFDIDPYNNESVKTFIKTLDRDCIIEKRKNMSALDNSYCINKNTQFFALLEKLQ